MTTVTDGVVAATGLTFTAPAKPFADAIKYVARHLDTKPAIPIHGGLHCHLSGATLTVSTLNETATATATLIVEPGEGGGGAFVVAGRLLAALAPTFTGDNVHIEYPGGPIVAVQAGRSRFTLPAMPEAEYPARAKPVDPIGSILAGGLAAAVRRVIPAAGTDPDKGPALIGAYLRFGEDGVCTVMASNRYQAARQFALWDASGIGAECLIPARTLADAIAEFPGEDVVTVGFNGRQLSLSTPTRSVTSTLLPVKDFPAAQLAAGFAMPPAQTATVAVKDAAAGLRSLRVFHDDKNQLKAAVAVEPGTMRVTVDGQSGGGEGDIDIEYDGPPARFVVNAGYLQDALSAGGADRVELSFTPDTYKPLVVSCPGDATWRYLVMPIRDLGGSK
jgi:DNA polymerase III subunit beta